MICYTGAAKRLQIKGNYELRACITNIAALLQGGQQQQHIMCHAFEHIHNASTSVLFRIAILLKAQSHHNQI
jgi:hypothetical protein